MKRPSVVLPSLMEDEKYFHDLVKFGDLQEVKEFLKQRPEFNINCTNFQVCFILQVNTWENFNRIYLIKGLFF